jgi:ABC-2 type transport system ATP-binding protein
MVSDKPKIAISIENLHKEFILPQSKNSTLKQAAVNIVKRNKKVTQKVLDGVSFNVNEGDFLGIIGRNGSGKSTLLKLIAGVYEPTSGNIYTYGGITPFIELGVGFNPELSGHDNVYLNGALLGFDRKQMDAMYDEIVSFAELGPFMDQKLKNYSSGMQVRLAFSIAIKAENDILIFDEVLAVGDSNFQEKCIRQFTKLKLSGKTIILVSHSMTMIEKFCSRVLLINAGKLVYDGNASDAIDRYEALNMEMPALVAEAEKIIDDRDVAVKYIDILDINNKASDIIESGKDFSIRFGVNSKKDIGESFISVRICDAETQYVVVGFDSKLDKKSIMIKQGDNEFVIHIKDNPILRGKYYMVIGIYESEEKKTHYFQYDGLSMGNFFLIKTKEEQLGIIKINRKWD